MGRWTKHTEWRPNRYTLFQCKATDTSAKKCRRKSKARRLEHQRHEFDSGAIGWRSLHPLSARLHATKRCQMRVKRPYGEVCEGMGKAYAESADIQVYDANKFPDGSTCLFLPSQQSEMICCNTSQREQMTWRKGAGTRRILYHSSLNASSQKRIATLRTHFAEPRRVARIIGLSGVGKTRPAFETFRPPPKPTDDATQYALVRVVCTWMRRCT